MLFSNKKAWKEGMGTTTVTTTPKPKKKNKKEMVSCFLLEVDLIWEITFDGHGRESVESGRFTCRAHHMSI